MIHSIRSLSPHVSGRETSASLERDPRESDRKERRHILCELLAAGGDTDLGAAAFLLRLRLEH